MANKERFLELDLEAPAGSPEGAPREKTRLGLRFTEQARYEWEVRGYELPARGELLKGRTAKLKQLLWAGLEGFREFHSEDRIPWTMRSVNDLVERAGGWGEHFSGPVLEAYGAAFPARKAARGGDHGEGKAEGGTAPPGADAPTGTPSSERRSATG